MTRELGLVAEVLSQAGMEVSYAHDDLVFLNHNGFLLQFTDWHRQMLIHTNVNGAEREMAGEIESLQREGAALGLVLSMGGQYCLTPTSENDGENIQLEFYPETRED